MSSTPVSAVQVIPLSGSKVLACVLRSAIVSGSVMCLEVEDDEVRLNEEKSDQFERSEVEQTMKERQYYSREPKECTELT